MKKIYSLLFVMLFSVVSVAQTFSVSGKLIDRDTKEGVYMATVQLLKSDSSFVKGALTTEDGSFSIPLSSEGKYILMFSSVLAYHPQSQRRNLGILSLVLML